MIFATILMLIATILCFPFTIKLDGSVNLDKATAKVVIFCSIVRIFSLRLYLDGARLYYKGTISGNVDCSKKSKTNVKVVEWENICLFVTTRVSQFGVLLSSLINVACLVADSASDNLRGKITCRVALGDKCEVVCRVACVVSLLSLLGVGYDG